jgi:ubiquinone/menaquinone biosynthesis C-methylase UbiE
MALRIDTTNLRRRRYLRLAHEVGLRPTDRVIELGCGYGDRSIAVWNHENPIVGVDILHPEEIVLDRANFTYRSCDATDLSMFPDESFDVAFAIGMLEHIHPIDRAEQAIREAQRVARRYAFVMPHRYAFIEPHYRLPLFGIWPDRLKDVVMRQKRGRWRPRKIHWLSAAAWLRLFDDPHARVLNHWYGPFLMSLIVVGGRDLPATDR